LSPGTLKLQRQHIITAMPRLATVYLTPDEQCKYKCSELLGWNTITRRNIALLEALRWGADVIITVDDDNIPLSSTYFHDFANLFIAPSGISSDGS